MKYSCDILVIGAGPAGTIAAAVAHQKGLRVLVIEKQQFPRFVIGESLLPTSMHHFEKAGFLEALENYGFEKKFGARFFRGEEVCLFDFSENFTPGWTYTYQAPRGDFDKVMADELEKQGVPVYYQSEVKNVVLHGTDSVTTVQMADGTEAEIHAKFIIDASGYGRVLPRLFDLDEPSNLSPRRAMFVHSSDTERPEGQEGVQITFCIVEREVWLWVIPFSNGQTSLGFVGDPLFFEKHTREDESTEAFFRRLLELEPRVADRFRDQEFLWEPKGITNYAISTKKMYGEGFALAGNATEFLDPVFSSGVGFATESGLRASELACRQLSGETVDWAVEYEQHMCQGIDTFRSYVSAWYEGTLQDIFFSPHMNDQVKRQICSVLAGYVWDTSNPFVRRHETALQTLLKAIRVLKEAK